MANVHIYAKLRNFIQLPLTFAKLGLFYIKRDHLVNFYISQEKREKLRYLCGSVTYLQSIWQADAEPVSEVLGC